MSRRRRGWSRAKWCRRSAPRGRSSRSGVWSWRGPRNTHRWAPRPAPRARRRAPDRLLHRCDRIALLRPLAMLSASEREPPDQLAPQTVGLDHGIDHQPGREMEDVDVLGVLLAELLGPRGPLVGIGDRLELVVVDRIDRCLR